MECFAHSGVQAVALCRGCGKGVCRECVRDLGYSGVVCSDQCQKKVVEYDALYNRSRDILARTRIAYYVVSVLFFTLGGFFAWQKDYAMAPFFVLFGMVTLTLAVMREKSGGTGGSSGK